MIKEIDEEKVCEYCQKYNIPYIVMAILYSRGFCTEHDIEKFLMRSEKDDAFDIKDMDKIVNRIQKAINNGEKICIYGDYDADGVTASSLLYSYLFEKGANVFCYIPERNKDGYGLNKNALNFIKDSKTNLIITVDNGISAFAEIEYANSLGMDVAVTDHHRVREELPCACAIVDPYRKECENLKNKNFAGVGVVLKVIEALEKGQMTMQELLEKYSEFVTIGTIGDSIELLGETKDIVNYGLKNISNSKKAGIISLIKYAGLVGKEIDSISVAFGIVPRINACGRMENAKLALELLLCENSCDADKIAKEVCRLNDLRKIIENKILDDVERVIFQNPVKKYEKIIVAEGKNWNHGVLGIVASKIVQKYGKPCILITIEGDESRASCRSIEGFSIYEALLRNSKWLTRFGGHPLAAGFSLKTVNLENFKKSLKEDAQNYHVPNSKLSIDFEIEPSQISYSIFEELNILQPYGNGNPEPVFGVFGVRLKKIISIGKGKHLKLIFEKQGFEMCALYFNKTKEDFLFFEEEVLDLAITIHKNEYMGVPGVSCYIVDLKLAGCDLKKIISDKNLYESFKRDNILNPNVNYEIPSREDFAKIYRYVKILKNKSIRVDLINKRLFNNNKNLFLIYITLDVLEELNLIRILRNADEYKITVNSVEGKVKISDSRILNFIKSEKENENVSGT